MTITESALLAALQAVNDPLTGKDVVGARQVKNLRIDGADVSFELELGYPANSLHAALRETAQQALRTLPGIADRTLRLDAQRRPAGGSNL